MNVLKTEIINGAKLKEIREFAKKKLDTEIGDFGGGVSLN